MSKLSDALRMIADEMDHREEQTVQTIHELYIRPLQESQILRNNEVAAQLQVSPSQVTKLIATGKLLTTADGRVTRYHLRQYLTPNGKTTNNH